MPKGNKQAEAANNKKLAEQKEAAVLRAVELYESLARLNPKKPPGYRTVCKMVEGELERETGAKIKLCHNTVRARSNGKLSPTRDNGVLRVFLRCSLPYRIQPGKGVDVARRREDCD